MVTALRSSLGRSAEPVLVLLTATGELDLHHPALVKGALVMTTAGGAKRVSHRLPPACEVLAIGKGRSLDLVKAVGELRNRGARNEAEGGGGEGLLQAG